MALANAPFRQAMLIDTDVIWLNNPDLLFDTPSYVSTGALFFRDRLLFEEKKRKNQPNQNQGGLQFDEVLRFIEHHASSFSVLHLNNNTEITNQASKLLNGFDGGANYFWKPATMPLADVPRLLHVQESSVVLLNRANHPLTLRALRRLLPTFNLGYG